MWKVKPTFSSIEQKRMNLELNRSSILTLYRIISNVFTGFDLFFKYQRKQNTKKENALNIFYYTLSWNRFTVSIHGGRNLQFFKDPTFFKIRILEIFSQELLHEYTLMTILI